MALEGAALDLSDNHATEILVVGWVFTALGIITVSLKLFSRLEHTKKIGWDDFFIFLSLALGIISTSLVSYSISLGYSYHTQVVAQKYGMKQLAKALKIAVIAFPFNIASFSFPNISIAILIIRLLGPNRLRAALLYTLVILQIVFAMLNIIVIFFLCTPLPKLWTHELDGKCPVVMITVFEGVSFLVVVYTTLTNFILAVVPITAFWKLKMRRSTKISLCIMMGLTFFSAVITAVKATYLLDFLNRGDVLYKGYKLVIWALVEQNVAVISACVPTLRPLASFFRRKFHTGKDTSTEQSQDSWYNSFNKRKKSSDEESNESQQDVLHRRTEE